MQTLKLADDLFDGLWAGTKHCTIRSGKRDIEPGKILHFESVPGNREFDVRVLRVVYTLACYITDEDAQKDGAPNAEILLEAMKRFYPDMRPFDIVTIVEF